MNNMEPKAMSKTISCCELLNLFRRYYQKKFGVDGMILFADEETEKEEFNSVHALTKSLFIYLTKNNKLCDKCENEWKNLKSNY